jgi:hypothetical protein
VEQPWPENGLHERTRNGYSPRSEWVRRQGLKSPLLSSILLPELLPDDDGTCRYLPFCAVARIRSGLRIPRAAGAYQDIRANMEQTSMRTDLDHHGRECLGHGGEAMTIVGKGIDAWHDTTC